MYKNKPIIIANRPFWRHPYLPWGWYSLVKDFNKINTTGIVYTDGYYIPGDNGGGYFKWSPNPCADHDNGGTTIRETNDIE